MKATIRHRNFLFLPLQSPDFKKLNFRMKYILALLVISGLFMSCKQSSSLPKFYGKEFDTAHAITVPELVSKMQDQQQYAAVVSGNVTESCQAEGCWLNLKNPGSNDIYVDWDHQFNLPKNLEGKKAFANGYAYYDSTQQGSPLAFKATGVRITD